MESKMTLAQDIAKKLKKEIKGSSLEILPSYRKLSELYKVSHTVIGQATQILTKEGLVSVAKGRKAEIFKSKTMETIENNFNSAEFIAENLLEKIETGQLRAELALPKINSYNVLGALMIGEQSLYKDIEFISNSFKCRKLPLLLFDGKDESSIMEAPTTLINRILYSEKLLCQYILKN